MTSTVPRRRARKGAAWLIYPVALTLVGGPAAWWGWTAWKANAAVQAEAANTPLETTICEQLLVQVSRENPKRFYICAAGRTTIVKARDGRRETMPMMANAVYELPLDRVTRVAGLGSGAMRYGWDGHYFCALKPGLAEGVKPLADVPVDENSC